MPKPSTPREKRRYRVKWMIDGHHKTRSLKVKAEAERLRSQLLVAASAGLPFDEATGLPVEWLRSELTWWSWSVEWLSLKWPRWAGTTRRTGVETLVELTPNLLRRAAPAPPDELREWLWTAGYVPTLPDQDRTGPCATWLQRWSLPLDELDPASLESALTAATTRQDGHMVSPNVATRRRNTLKSVLKVAVRRGLIDANPMDRVEWDAPQQSTEIDVSTLPSVPEVEALLDYIEQLPSEGARYSAFLAMIGLAGLRPSEVAGLMTADLALPSDGWGLARLRGAITSPGSRYTGHGRVRETKGLKHRAAGTTREVPLPPSLVHRLVQHFDRWPGPADGLAFNNAAGRPVTAENYGKVWAKARSQLWPTGPLAKTPPYDLRHTAATTMLRAGVSLPEVSRRLGHSVDVLLRVYAGVFHDERDRSNAMIDAELHRQQNLV